MARKYKKVYGSRRPLKTVKYSNETYNITNTISIASGGYIYTPLVSASDVQGVRKAKNFTLKVFYAGITPLMFVLAYVPENQKPQAINRGSSEGAVSLYEPNQNVIMSGYITPNYNTMQTFRTRLARNLNSGDTIQMILAPAAATDAVVQQLIGISLNYAITY